MFLLALILTSTATLLTCAISVVAFTMGSQQMEAYVAALTKPLAVAWCVTFALVLIPA